MSLRNLLIALPVLLTAVPVAAQEAVKFGDWRAYCAPVAGCVLGVKSDEGDTLAFVHPPSGDDRLLLFLREPVMNGAEIEIALDGKTIVTLGPADGWRPVESKAGKAVQIAPSIVREGLSGPMRRRDTLELIYPVKSGEKRQIMFSLNGYADTRSYADDG